LKVTERDHKSAITYLEAHCGLGFVPFDDCPQDWIKARKVIKELYQKSIISSKYSKMEVSKLMKTPIFDNGRRVSKTYMKNPIIVVKFKNKLRVIDGNHRVLTASENGIKILNCLIVDLKDSRFNLLLD